MGTNETLKILVIDDTIIYRKIISEVLKELPDVEIIGTANNGKTAISRIRSLHPDLITLDIDMPRMDGIEVLQEINRLEIDVGVIMLSSLTYEGGEMTIKALELGAFDFIPKPELDSISANRQFISEHLGPMLRSFSGRREIKRILSGRPYARPRPLPPSPASPAAAAVARSLATTLGHPGASPAPKPKHRAASQIAVIGVSTGGPKALATLIPLLPTDLNIPVLVVQHMPALFTQSLAQSLDGKSALKVLEATDGSALMPNTVFIAPGGKQMKVAANHNNAAPLIRITDDPPENSCKPSVDYLFRSVAECFGARATGIIMTGMGTDGNLGIAQMREKQAFLIAQDEATCTVFGMPRWPIEANIVDVVAPLENIAAEIIASVKSPG